MEITLVLRLAEGDDPTVAHLMQRCHAAAAAFGGDLAAWEASNAFARLEASQEKLRELQEHLRIHGLLAEDGALPRVAGEVAHGAAPLPRRPGPGAPERRPSGLPLSLLGEEPEAPAAPQPPQSDDLAELAADLHALARVVHTLGGALAAQGVPLPAASFAALQRILHRTPTPPPR